MTRPGLIRFGQVLLLLAGLGPAVASWAAPPLINHEGLLLDSTQFLSLADLEAPNQVLVLLSGVDGEGSGLDADRLDGLQGSRFMRVDQDTGTSGTLSVGADLQLNGDLVLGGDMESSGTLSAGAVQVAAGGRVGVGVADPQAEVHVSGKIMADTWVLDARDGPPEDPVPGTLYFDTESRQFIGYDGEAWISLSNGAIGGGPGSAGRSCRHILTEQGGDSGTYWIDPNGGDDGDAFQVYCDMSLSRGGWTLVAKFSNQDGKHWVNSAARWTGQDAYGVYTDLSSGQDAKSPAWSLLAANEVMFTDHLHAGSYVVTISDCLEGLTTREFFTAALATFPWGGDNFFKRCDVQRSYFPSWAAEPDWGGHGVGHNDLSLTHGYMVFARTDPSRDTSGVVSFYRTDFGEADVGLGSLEDGSGFAPSSGDWGRQRLCPLIGELGPAAGRGRPYELLVQRRRVPGRVHRDGLPVDQVGST